MELEDNLRALEELFHDFEVIDQRKIWMSAFRRSAQPLVDAAKANAPIGKTRKRKGTVITGGNLRRSIGVVAMRDEIAVLVGARRGGGYKGWHGHLVESGTRERFTKEGYKRGSVDGKRFFEPAFESTQEQMYDGVAAHWYEEIDKHIIKIQRK